MKKLFSFFLTVVLLFSLASCALGDKGSADDALTKANNAAAAPIDDITAAKAADIAEAEKTYVGTTYSFSGHVAKINDESIELIPYGYFDSVTAHMSKNDINKLSENELINIVGEISKLDCGEAQLAELTNSRYIDSTVTITGWIKGFDAEDNGKTTASIIDIPYSNSNKKVNWTFELDSKGNSDSDSTQGDILSGKYGSTSLSVGTFVTIKCNAEFTHFDAASDYQNEDFHVTINKITKLTVN